MPETTETSAVSTESASSSSSPSSSSSSTPVDTASIAANVIRDAEAGNEEAVAEPAQGQSPADPDDFDQVPTEVEDSLGRKRKNSIPHDRVGVMITKKVVKREKELISQVAKELGITKAEAELTLDDVLGNVRERGTRYTALEDELSSAKAIEQIMESDGDRFIQILAETDPQRYGKFLKVLEAGGTSQQAAAAATTPAAGDDPEPEPDYDMGNGQMTYSKEGFQKLREWERRQGKRDAEALIDAKLSPYEQERKQREKVEKARKVHEQAQQAVDKAIERASKWPGFSENAEAIAKLITANPNLDLVDAYMQVVPAKLTSDRTTMRQELLAEINQQPHSTSVAPSATGGKKTAAGPKTTEDIAREVIKQFTT